jgi:TetR/AcrR family transcriptional repressor of bet genes
MAVAQKSPDKRRVRGEESRKLILKSAVDSIATVGLGKLTLDRVADRVGISRGLVVFHFKTKDNLIEEVLAYLGRQYAGGWEAVLEKEFDSDMEKLLQLIDYDIRFACDYPKYVSAWHAYWGETKGNSLYRDRVVQRDEGYARDMEKLVEKISEDCGYDNTELSLITRGLFNMMFGNWVQMHLNPDISDFELNSSAVRLFLSRVFPDTEISY